MSVPSASQIYTPHETIADNFYRSNIVYYWDKLFS